MPLGKHRTHQYPPWRKLLWLLALLLVGNSMALADPVMVSDSPASQPLTARLDQLEDPTRQLTIEQVARQPLPFTPVATDFLNLGYTSSAYWFRLRLRNDLAYPVERIIEVEQPYLGRVEAYLPRTDTEGFLYLAAGDDLPFSLRAVRHRLPVFPISLPAHTEQTIYLRVETKGAFTFSATLWEPLEHGRKDRVQSFFLGAYYGFLLILLIYNAAFFFGTHDQTNIFFAGYVICIGLFQLVWMALPLSFRVVLWRPACGRTAAAACFGNAACGMAALFTRSTFACKLL
jgi:7TM diverse intracellular signalling./7TMR-DISM extracellular 2.